MAIEVKLDLLGSTLALGYTDFRKTRGVRRGIVRGLLNNQNAVRQAINSVTRDVGPFHPSVPNLPLASVQAVKLGPEKALVRLNYQFSTFRPPFGNLPAFTTVKTFSIEKRTKVYRGFTDDQGNRAMKNGLPDGHLIGYTPEELLSEKTTRVAAWVYSRPAVKLVVNTTLDFNPIGQVLRLLRTVNDSGVLFAGFTFAPFTIMFDNINVDWNTSNTSGRNPNTVSLVFRVQYIFTAVAGGHYHQRLVKKGEEVGGFPALLWTTINELSGTPESFAAGVFPVHA